MSYRQNGVFEQGTVEQGARNVEAVCQRINVTVIIES
jgi:hypothetical protein